MLSTTSVIACTKESSTCWTRDWKQLQKARRTYHELGSEPQHRKDADMGNGVDIAGLSDREGQLDLGNGSSADS